MSNLLDWLLRAITALDDAFWGGTARVLDVGDDLGPLPAALLAALAAAAWLAAAVLMQRRLVHRLAAAPDRRVGFADHEVWFFLPAWPFLPFRLLSRVPRALGRAAARLRRSRRDAESAEGAGGGPAPAPAPFLAASLGPSFWLGGAATALLYLASRLTDPLLAARLGLAPGASAWEHLLLGGRPEIGPHLPLSLRSPYLAALLLFLFWGTVWWWAARGVRLVYWRRLGGNLLDRRDDPTTLRPWREWCAVRRLVAPAPPYRLWAGGLTACAVPLVALSWFAAGGVPYRVAAADLAAALVVWLAWVTHLALRGAERLPPEPGPETEDPAAARVAGWPEVAADLRERLQIDVPLPFRDPRPIAAREVSDVDLADEPLLSPLLAELVPARDGRRRLTRMQAAELRRLARLGHVFTRPLPARGELALGAAAPEEEAVRERNRIVLAPEGTGKTTLAILAAANHALVHTRSSLLVTRGESEAEALHERIGRLLDVSTLRWNLRLRRVGDDMAADLSRGIVPDVVVVSLHHLTATLLDQADAYAPLFRHLGLVVVDDVESFAGPVETHAQLALRRLALVTRKLVGADQLGERAAPLVLALGGESVDRAAAWVGSLVGIDAETERYPAPPAGEGEREQLFYRLSDFRAATGERLTVAELIESCERAGAAWHYRPCADGRRGIGRHALYLHNEPAAFTASPLGAAAVLLEGAWSEVRREVERLALAGSDHPWGPCALITLVDPDEEMAFTQHDPRLTLASELAALPRPVLRPPTGRTVAAHLAADLTRSWTEVGDLLRTFGNASALKLRELAREALLLTEDRVDVHPRVHDYEHKLFVRALATAVAEPGDDRTGSPLPPKVADVELAAATAVPVVDRTDLDLIATVDADSAALAYYPGRVFDDARGRFVVVHQVAHEGGDGRERGGLASDDGEREVPEGAVLVEPLLGDEISSPRRRVRVVETLANGRDDGGVEGAVTGHAFYGPDPLRLGEHPIEVELGLLRLEARHAATYLLGPTFCEVRQRRLYTGAGGLEPRSLTTVALRIFPNPEQGGAAAPALRFEQARLVAAAMRAALPALYRGAAHELAVGLDVAAERPEPHASLATGDSFVLFDVHSLGNGIARAVHRDGVELLLRLTRLILERVLYHDRLLALHDHWPDDGTGAAPAAGEGGLGEGLRRRREHEEAVRHGALEWLDSRLRPEGDAAAFAGALGFDQRESEPGEGDVIDVGRCWYSRDRSLADLLWAKHRWRHGADRELMLDAGFDRRTAELARRLDLGAPRLTRARERHRAHLADPAFALPDGTAWGAPRGVWRVEGEEKTPHCSQAGALDAAVAAYHEAAATLAADAWAALGPLARKLNREHRRLAGAGEADRFRLAALIASFVQGIPTARPADGDELERRLQPPVTVLLEHRGDAHAKALLLALLLEGCGIPAGIFLSTAERRALAGAALADPVDLATAAITVFRDEEGRFATHESSTGEPERYLRGRSAAAEMHRCLAEWSAARGLAEPPPAWSELPLRNEAAGDDRAGDGPGPEIEPAVDADRAPAAGTGGGDRSLLYVPIETTAGVPPGVAHLEHRDTWLFLPLVSVLHGRPRHVEAEPEGEEALPR